MRLFETFPLSHQVAAGLLFALMALFALSVPFSLLFAHEGEVHEEPEVTPALMPEEGSGVVYAQSEQFELVVRHPPLLPHKSVPLTLFLSEYATNAPVAAAGISLGLTGSVGQQPMIAQPTPDSVSVIGPLPLISERHTTVAQPTRNAGIYRAQMTFPAEGSYELLFSISADRKQYLLRIGGLQAKKAGAGAAEKKGRRMGGSLLWGLGGTLLAGLLLLSLWLALRKGGKTVGPVGKALLLALMAGSVVGLQGASWAHEGESYGERKEQGSGGASPPVPQPPRSPAPPLPSLPGPPVSPVSPSPPVHLSKESQFLLGIRTQPAQTRELGRRVSAPGRVIPKPELEAEVFAPQPGKVMAAGGFSIPRIGEWVKKGQLLVVIEQVLSAPERIQIAAERVRFDAEVRQAQERLAQEERDLERARSLRQVIAEKEIQRTETEYRVAQEELKRLEQAKALYDGAEEGKAEGLKRFSLQAPIGGVITEAHLTQGEQVETSRQLFKIIDPSVVWVEAQVFEGQIPRIGSAQEAEVTSSIYPQETFQGKLVNLGQVIDELTRTVRTVFEVPNPQGRLLIGMFLTLSIGTGRPEKAIVVPAGAVLEQEGKRMVYIHTRPEDFVPRQVVVGTKEGGWVAIERGVAVGERVVTEGVYQLEAAAKAGGSR